MAQALQCLLSLIVIGLMVTGLTGLAHHFFRDEGWLDVAASSAWNAAMQSPGLALLSIVVAAAVTAACLGGKRQRRGQDRAATAVLYAIMACGIYFTGRLVAVGSF